MSTFRHIVLFRWVEGTTAEQIEAVIEGLAALPGQIPEIARYTLGRDAGIGHGNFDFGVVADFLDEDAYLVYRDHPLHRRVIDERITALIAERVAVQISV